VPNHVTSERLDLEDDADTTLPQNLDYVVSLVTVSNGPGFVACFDSTAVVTDQGGHTHTGHTAIDAWYGSDYFAIQSHIEGHEVGWVNGQSYGLTIQYDGGRQLSMTAGMAGAGASSKIDTLTLSGIAAG
jgi:hypothetical protein